jgi:hypothetical protein
MANTDDLASSYCARLDKIIADNIKKLVSCKADEHDSTAGRIKGLQEAKDEFTKIVKTWRLKDGEDE